MTTRRFFCYGVVPALFLQAIGAYVYFVLLADTAYASPVYSAVKILLFVWPLIWLALGAPLPRFTLRFDQRSVLLGLGFGLVLASAIIACFLALQSSITPFAAQITAKANDLFPLRYYVPITILFSLVHSLFEEYFWRWFVYRGLRLRLGALAATLIGSSAFVLHHIIVLNAFFPWPLVIMGSIGVGVGGALWCCLYEKTGSLTASWISHALVDGAIFTVGYWLIF